MYLVPASSSILLSMYHVVYSIISCRWALTWTLIYLSSMSTYHIVYSTISCNWALTMDTYTRNSFHFAPRRSFHIWCFYIKLASRLPSWSDSKFSLTWVELIGVSKKLGQAGLDLSSWQHYHHVMQFFVLSLNSSHFVPWHCVTSWKVCWFVVQSLFVFL